MYSTKNASGEAVSLDGVYIEDKIEGYRTLSVQGRESLEYDVTDKDRPVGMDGMEYFAKRQKSRIITIRYELQAYSASDFMARYRKLKNFVKGEDREIRFADEPNAHYTGTILAIDPPEFGRLSVVSEMRFYCADPYLVSDLITTVAAQMEEGKLVAHVNNDGSGPVYPVYRIKHKAENGYIAIVHKGGAFEMGNRDEVDKIPYKQNETLAKLENFASLPDDHGVNFMHPNHRMDGTLMGGNGNAPMQLGSIGEETPGKWCGGMRTIVLPEDSEGEPGAGNFFLFFRHWFQTAFYGQTGEQSIACLTKDNKLICGCSLYSADMVGNAAVFEMWANGRVVKVNTFASSHINAQNPYNEPNGYNCIKKEDDRICFYWFGSYPVFAVPEVKDMVCRKIQIAFTQHAGQGGGEKYVTRNYLRELTFEKMNVKKWSDVPNRYPASSKVVVDCEEDSIAVRGLPRNEELVTGSEFYSLPTGETDIEFYTSTWCKEQPEVTVEFRKRWI